jgi:hypothetical protein
MPLINPTKDFVKDLLRESNILDTKSLDQLLKDNNLDIDNLLSELRMILDSEESSTIKLRAIETGLRLNKVLDNKDQGSTMPTFVINIQDNITSVNPILIPRDLTL